MDASSLRKKELTTQDKVRMIFSEDRFIELQKRAIEELLESEDKND